VNIYPLDKYELHTLLINSFHFVLDYCIWKATKNPEDLKGHRSKVLANELG